MPKNYQTDLLKKNKTNEPKTKTEKLLKSQEKSTTNQKSKVDDNLHFHVKILSALGRIKSVIGLRANNKCYWPGSFSDVSVSRKISAYMKRITSIYNESGIKGNIKNKY